MVSYYNNPVAMFGRPPSHHHHVHSSPTQNHYFAPAYSGYHPHLHHHNTPAPAPALPANMGTDFNCSHQYHNHFGNMGADSMAAASWHQPMYGPRNIPAYDELSYPHNASFYHHQHSPPSSTSSPTSNIPPHSPAVYNSTHPFKTEFGPCSSGGNQETGGEIGGSGVVVSSGGPSLGTPHSPDSGMAISDGVSSSGSPATGAHQTQHCLAGPHHASSMGTLNGGMVGSQNSNLNAGQQSLGRPSQARSPYEWMKKPTYVNSSTSSGGKTRTKDKYRVVYSDLQRLELEKEFHYSRYITIRRKAELATFLGLSERQVKIWFQNRRAKERKVTRKREEMMNREKYTMIHMPTGGMGPGPMCNQSPNTVPPLM